MASKPILSSIPAFDARFGTEGYEHIEAPILSFSLEYGSYVARKNRVVIHNYNNPTERAYDCTIETMELQHQLHPENSSLRNGEKYIAKVYVVDQYGEESLASNEVIFYCYESPQLTFKNFNVADEWDVPAVKSTSISFAVEYQQKNKLPINSYNFVLQDPLGKVLDSSGNKYNVAYGETLRWTVGGVDETELVIDENGDLKPNGEYKVICTVETKHGFVVQIEQKFVVRLEVSGVGALVKAENVGDGTVAISSNYKILNTQCSNKNPIYVYDADGNPYAIDLTQGDYVEFIDGFLMDEPYEVIFKGDFKVGRLVTLRNKFGHVGYIDLKKITYTTAPFYYFSFSTERDGILYEIRSHYFRYGDGLVSAEVDLSYYNKLYNLKAKIDYNDTTALVNDDGRGNVDLYLINDANITDDNNGNITLDSGDITVSGDGDVAIFV